MQPRARFERLVREEDAVVLRWRAYGESDKIVALLSRVSGRFTGIAKGARRSRRRFPGSLEALARVRVRHRPPRGEGLAFLESATLRTPPGGLVDPLRFAYGCYLAELAEQFTVEGQPCAEVFELLDAGLAMLARAPARSAFLRAYELKLLDRAGLRPRFGSCTRCRSPVPRDGAALLAPHSSQLLCPRCGEGSGAPHAVPGDLLAELERLAEAPLEACAGGDLGQRSELARDVAGHLLGLHLRRPLRSLELLRRLEQGRPPGEPAGRC